jgi:hypothetical protein
VRCTIILTHNMSFFSLLELFHLPKQVSANQVLSGGDDVNIRFPTSKHRFFLFFFFFRNDVNDNGEVSQWIIKDGIMLFFFYLY